MFIPLKTDRPTKRRPVVTETLIVINMAIYLVGLMGGQFGWWDFQQGFTAAGAYQRGDWAVWTLISYQFLHDPVGFGGVLHLGINMVFLWVFGTVVEDRLGRLSFLSFYLIAGIIAGIAHGMVSPVPVIGASGSIAGVTGAFLALAPRSHIKVLVIFFIIGIFHVPSLWFIGLFFALDVFQQVFQIFGVGGSRTAFMAHIAGYVYGFSMAVILLGLNVIKHDDYDVFFLWKQSRRRSAFRRSIGNNAAGPWESASADTPKRIARLKDKRKRDVEDDHEPERTVHDEKTMAKRAEINRLMAEHDLSIAAKKYRTMLDDDPEALFPEERQLDLANQLYAENDHEHAATAYELFLQHYPRAARATEVRLILGLLYTRQLHKPDRAKELIRMAKEKLADPKQSQLAERLLGELGT